MEIQSFALDTGASPAVAAARDAERKVTWEVFDGMIPGRAAPDSVQTFTAAERKRITAIQNRENAEGCPQSMRTPEMPHQSGKLSPKRDAKMTRLALAMHASLTGDQFEPDWTGGEVRDRTIVGFDRTFTHYMEVSAFLRGLRAIGERAHHHCPELLRTEPLAVREHAHGYVVVVHDGASDPDAEFGSPVSRFGTVAECEAFIDGVRAS